MNYLKISRQLVCKMAMLLAFMLAACSDDHVAGGVTEETRIYALAGYVGEVYPMLLKSADDVEKTRDSLEEGSVFAAKGTKVSVFELDSLTLEKTGRSFVGTVDNDSGRFAFENLELNSPYVLVETQNSCYMEGCQERGILFGYQTHRYSPTYCEDSVFVGTAECSNKYLDVVSAIVDLRNVKKISVSSLTTSKIPLLQKYFAEGMSFAEASEMAEREILEKLGIYENLGAFEDLSRNDSELLYVNELFRLGDFDIRFGIDRIDIPLYFAPPKAFSVRGEGIEQYYLNSMKMIGYKVGYLARQDGLGQCTEARENEAGKVKSIYNRYDVAVVCRSGKWTLGFKAIEHAKGTLTDKRDGKTYKTVTYNWGGATQTWMAENLDFAEAADSCYRSWLDDGNCKAYGLAYQWNSAMNIKNDDIKAYFVDAQGDTVFMSKRCLDAYFDESNLDSVKAIVDSCDTALYGSDSLETKKGTTTWTWNYTDFITPANQNSYQGVCPDGWRIPTFDDWKTLLQNLGEQYGVDYRSVVPVLYDEVATGFDMKSYMLALGDSFRVLIRNLGFYNYFVVADTRFYVVEFFNQWTVSAGFDLNFPSTRHMTIFKDDNKETYPELLQGSFGDPYRKAAVRCIKN